MAHFAELDNDNTVIAVVVVDNDRCGSDPSKEEERGIAYLASVLGPGRRWIQTSYNGNFRKRYATIGGLYNAEYDAFIAPQPFPSWTLDSDLEWQAPVPYPSDGNVWFWDEEAGQWFEGPPAD